MLTSAFHSRVHFAQFATTRAVLFDPPKAKRGGGFRGPLLNWGFSFWFLYEYKLRKRGQSILSFF